MSKKLKRNTMGIWEIPCKKKYKNRRHNKKLRRETKVRKIVNGAAVTFWE